MHCYIEHRLIFKLFMEPWPGGKDMTPVLSAVPVRKGKLRSREKMMKASGNF